MFQFWCIGCGILYIVKFLEGFFMLKVVIAGYRNFDNYYVLKEYVDACLTEFEQQEFTIISGHCKGVDLMGERYAKEKGYSLEIYPADWKKYGRAAGPIRNKQMAENTDILIAFTCDKATGTKNMISNAKKLDKKIFIKDIGELV